MHFLARLLQGEKAVSEELARDERQLHTELGQFFKSFRIKEEVLEHLLQGEPMHLHLHKLNYALQEEIRIVEETEHTEKEILSDLKYMSREHYIRKLEEICVELNHAKDRDRYIRHILSELHDTLMSEARKVRKILHGNNDLDLREAIIDLLTIERHLVEKLTTIEDFRHLFTDLYTGTQLKNAVVDARKRLEKRVRERMKSVEVMPDGSVNATEDHYIAGLTARVFNRLDAAVNDAIKGGYISKHQHVDIEFVQSVLFDKFLAEELEEDKQKGKVVPSPRTMQAFTNLFRQMYTQVPA